MRPNAVWCLVLVAVSLVKAYVPVCLQKHGNLVQSGKPVLRNRNSVSLSSTSPNGKGGDLDVDVRKARRLARRRQRDRGDEKSVEEGTNALESEKNVATSAATTENKSDDPQTSERTYDEKFLERLRIINAFDGTDMVPEEFADPDEVINRDFKDYNITRWSYLDVELPVPDESMTQDEESEDDSTGVKFKIGEDGRIEIPDVADALTKLREQGKSKTPRKSLKKKDGFLDNIFSMEQATEPMEYDLILTVFGGGKLMGFDVPFLQTGHTILLLAILLSTSIYYPGNPITELPPELRQFLRTGLTVTYSINTFLAVSAFMIASQKKLPAALWAVKTFVLGGLAYFELSRAVPMRPSNS